MTASLLRLALAATLVAVGAGPAAAQRSVVDEVGYVSPRLNAEEALEIGYLRSGYDGQGEQWSAADDTVLHTRAGSATTVPDWAPLLGLDMLGAPGTPIWSTEQTAAEAQTRATIQFGWTRRQLAGGLLAPSGSSGTLHAVSGPAGGRLVVYTVNRDDPDPSLWFAHVHADSGAALPVELWRAGNGSENTQRFSPHWAFTRPGTYCIDFEVRATLASGRPVLDRRVLAVAVGDVDPQQATCERDEHETTTTLSVSPRSPVEEGTDVTLAAAVAPSTATGAVRFLDGETPLGDPVPVAGGEARLTRALPRGRHTLRAEFVPDGTFAPSSATFGPYRVHAPHAYVLETAADERLHADVAARTEGDRLLLQLKIDAQPTTWTPLDDGIVVVPERARLPVPDDPQFRFIGPAGSDLWLIDLVQQAGVPWLGISSESIADAAYERYTSWRLEGVTGPGHFILWDRTDGAKPYFSTRTGVPDAVRMLARASGHWHANWGFTAPGVYCLGFAVANRAAGTGAPVGERQVLTVVVGDDVDPYRIETCAQRGVRPVDTHPVAPRQALPGERYVLDSEGGDRAFADLTPRIAGGRLDVPLVVGSPLDGGVAYDLDDVILRAGPSTAGTLPPLEPEGSRVPWVGDAGQRLWEIRENVDASRYVLGWSTLAVGDLTWRLLGVEGPGDFVLHDEWGQRAGQPLFSTRPGFGADRHELWGGRRDRGSWVFSAPGVSCVDVEWSGSFGSVRKRLTFAVGDVDPATVVPCGQGGHGDPPPSEGGPPAPGAGGPSPARPRVRVGLSLRLARRSVRIATLRRRGTIRATCGLDAPGRCDVRATISARDARRLRLRTTALGTGRVTLANPGRRTVTIKLRRIARAALRRVKRRLSIRLAATGRAAGRDPATRTVVLVARR